MLIVYVALDQLNEELEQQKPEDSDTDKLYPESPEEGEGEKEESPSEDKLYTKKVITVYGSKGPEAARWEVSWEQTMLGRMERDAKEKEAVTKSGVSTEAGQ